jgi:hypothetical protein
MAFELLDDEFLLGDDVFHQVADGDETDQLALVHDGQMSHASFRHRRHAFFAGLAGAHVLTGNVMMSRTGVSFEERAMRTILRA